jgi:hypothetical protein
LTFGNPKVNVKNPDSTPNYLTDTNNYTNYNNSYIAGIEFISDSNTYRYEWNNPKDPLRPFVYAGCDRLLKLIVPNDIQITHNDASFFLFSVGKMTAIDSTTLSRLPNI